MNLARKMSLAYWPNPHLNESADVARGDAAVDALTVGELHQFFQECTCGPTFCMVRRRVAQYRPLIDYVGQQ